MILLGTSSNWHFELKYQLLVTVSEHLSIEIGRTNVLMSLVVKRNAEG
jgi:hypothetical protein